MKFINFDTVLNCEKNNYINKNKFTPRHCSNFLIVGKNRCWKNKLSIKYFTFKSSLG